MDINYNESLPSSLIKLIKEHVDDDTSQFLLQEINNTISLEYSTPPLVDEGKTFGNWTTGLLPDFTRDYRNYLDQLSFEIIEQMIKSSPVRFAVEMKRAQIVSVFRNQRSWKINCIDKELGDIVRANLINILSKMALDFSYSSLVYGVSFQELVWEYKTKAELGLQEDTGGEKYVVAKVPNSIDPKTIDYIKRDKKGHFNGFVQRPISVLSAKEIIVDRESALVIPYNEKWRNLWGESFLAPMYPIWFWYEVVLRSMVKYMERTGTPVVKVRAPSRATVTKPGTKTKVDGISWGMEIGSNLPRSNTVVIPSDRDEQGNSLWEIDYMSSSERAQPFMDILELLFQMILRAGLSADRALSQSSGGVGSYSIGEIHKEATALHNEMILIQWVYYLNQYFLPLYSLYNRGTNGPVITIETQGLDPFDRDNLKTILGVMQGSESFKNVSYKIDWDSLFTTNNVPTISDEEAEAKKKKQQEEALSNQENMLSVQSKFSSPSPTKQADGSLKANMPNKVADKKLEVEEDILELEQIDLFNPFHSKADGRFTSGKGGISGGIVSPNRNKIAEQPKEFNIGGLLVKTALVGGGLAAGGLMVSSLIAQANENEQMQKRLDLIEKGFTPDQVNKLMEVGYHSYAVMQNSDGTYSTTVFLDDGTMMDSGKSTETNIAFSKSFDGLADKNREELSDLINQANIDIDNLSDEQIIALSRNGLLERIKSLNSGKISIMSGDYQFADVPKFNNKADVDKFLTDRYAALGVDLDTSKIQFSTDKEGLWGNITRDVFGNPNGRIVNIEETWFNKLFGNGQGEKVFVTHALAHEYGHSLQGFGQGEDGNITRPTDNDDLYRIEGGAEVYARLALAPYKVNAGPDYKEYTTSTGVAAGLMDAYIKKTDADLPSALKSYNSNIASNVQHYQYLKNLFPDRMENKTTLPSQATIQNWLEQDYNVTTEQSMDDLMQMALSMNGK